MQEIYKKEGMKKLEQKFGYTNMHEVPKITKVVLNTGFGKLITPKTGDDYKKTLDAIEGDISVVAGQHAVLTKAKQSIAGFKVREGAPVGAKVTLRGKRMYDFLDRLVHVVLPRSRDFRGIKQSTVDANGNFTLGIKEHIFFPEISPENVKNIIGLQITVTATAKTHEEGLELFKSLGFPFTKD